MRAGPKPEASTRALPPTGDGVDGLDAWLRRWVRVPRGAGAGGPFVLREYQRAIATDMVDEVVRLVLWVAGRGNGKSGLSAGLGLHHIVEGAEGSTAAIVSTDERAAARVLRTATRMVETSPSLSKRITVYAVAQARPRMPRCGRTASSASSARCCPTASTTR